ncbi:MAG: hypothetical protein ACK5JJ_07315 [Cyanobacteriota bacterium]|jgi:hypothetical protein
MSWTTRHARLGRVVNRHLGGVSVTAGAVSGDALLEQNAEMVIDGQVLSVECLLTNALAATFGELERGEYLIVGGSVYQVRHAPSPVGDGLFCVVPLQKPEQQLLEVVNGAAVTLPAGTPVVDAGNGSVVAATNGGQSVAGLMAETVASGASGSLLIGGVVEMTTTGWAVGTLLYVSAGGLSPVVSGAAVARVVTDGAVLRL